MVLPKKKVEILKYRAASLGFSSQPGVWGNSWRISLALNLTPSTVPEPSRLEKRDSCSPAGLSQDWKPGTSPGQEPRTWIDTSSCFSHGRILLRGESAACGLSRGFSASPQPGELQAQAGEGGRGCRWKSPIPGVAFPGMWQGQQSQRLWCHPGLSLKTWSGFKNLVCV